MDIPTGTLVAAVIETVGYYSQETILEGMTVTFFRLGILIYVIAIIYAIMQYMMTSSPRIITWLIICPGIFSFLIFCRTESSGSVWRFGTYDDKLDGFDSLPAVLQKQFPDKDLTTEKAKVSWAFDRWNVFVSNVYNELIKIITKHDSFRAQMRFMSRARLTDIIFRTNIQDPGLESLIVTGLSSYCADAMDALRDIAYARANPTLSSISTSLQHSLAVLPALFSGQRFTFKQNSPARTYLAGLLHRLHEFDGRAFLIGAFCEGLDIMQNWDQDVDYEDEMVAMTCEQVWCWSTLGVYLEALKLAELAECRYTPKLLHMCTETDSLDAIHPGRGLDALRRSMMQEVWKDVASKFLSSDISGNLIENSDAINLRYIPVMMTGVMLRKALTIDPRTYLTTEYAEEARYYTSNRGFDSEALRSKELSSSRTLDAQNELGASLRYDSYVFASRIPYLQGGLLYGLAVLFPFFALFVLIPGKGRAIFTWMSLWAWVKSWDVGYALVMVADEVLWTVLPSSAQYSSSLNTNQNGPLQLLEGAFKADPSYSISTYYMILAALIMAVPMVTAQFMLGAQSSIAGTFNDRMSGSGSKIRQGQFVVAQRRQREAQQQAKLLRQQRRESLPSSDAGGES